MDYVDVSSVFYPLYLHSRCFGCNLFHLPKSVKATGVSLKVTDILILVIYVTIYGWMFLSVNYSQSENDKTLRSLLFHLTEGRSTVIIAFVGRVLFYSFALTNLFMSIMDITNRNRIWKLLCEIRSFDAKMKKLGVLSNRYITRNSFITYAAFIVALYITNVCVSYVIYKFLKMDDIIVAFRFYAGAQMSDGCFASLVTIFIFFLHSILERFRKINQIVMQFFSLKGDLNILVDPSRQNLGIREIAKLYLQLSGVVKIASDTYSMQVMLAIFSASSFSLMSVYMIYRIVIAFDVFLLIGSTVYISRAIFYNIFFFIVFRLSTAISTESKQIASLINKAITKSGNDASTNQLEQFSHQVTHCTNEITCGLFKFDWNIVHVMYSNRKFSIIYPLQLQIVGASLTYLTYFIQFDQQMENAILID